MQPPYEPPNPFQPNFWKAKFKIISQSMENSISCPYWHSKFEGERQFCRLDHYVSKEPYSTLIKAHLYATTRALFLVIPNRISRQADDWSGNCTRIFYFFEETTHGGKIEDGVGPPTPPEMSSMKNPEREEPADRLARFLCCSIHCKTLLVALKKIRKGTI